MATAFFMLWLPPLQGAAAVLSVCVQEKSFQSHHENSAATIIMMLVISKRLWRSVKREDVYLKGYATMTDLMLGLTEYFTFYNTTRMHQSLGYHTSDQVYLTASGGGAKIIDKYRKAENISSEIESKNRDSAVPLHE